MNKSEYPNVERYWSAESEDYAGGDVLVTFFHQGWEVHSVKQRETHWHHGTRPTHICHIQLKKGLEMMSIPVLMNPFVRQLINDLPVFVK